MKTWGYNGVSDILQIYNPAIFYCHRTSLCLLAIFKTNKISNAGSCTPTEWWKREATMGFLTIFYKYINPAIFYCQRTSLCLLAIFKTNKTSNAGSCTSTQWWKREATMGFLTIFYKYINPAIFYCHRTSLCLLAIFKTNKISNAGSCTPTQWWKREATMGFLTIFYKYINPAIFYCHRTSLCLLAIFKTNKTSNAGSCTSTEWWKREATMGFLTIFYKYINPAIFYCQRTSLCLLAIFKTNKISNAGSCRVRNLKFATYLKFATCENTNKIKRNVVRFVDCIVN